MEQQKMNVALKQAVIKAIHDAFSLPVYGERVQKGAKMPCFSVVVQESRQKRLLGRRRAVLQTLAVEYHTADRMTGKEESISMADRLYEVLWMVGDTEKFLAEVLRHEERENGIIFLATYTWHIILQEKEEKMQRLEINGKKAVGYDSGNI